MDLKKSIKQFFCQRENANKIVVFLKTTIMTTHNLRINETIKSKLSGKL